MNEKQKLITEIESALPSLDAGFLQLLSSISEILQLNVQVTHGRDPVFDDEFAKHFAGYLLIHHALSDEAFTKDKFEHAMVRVLNENEHSAMLSSRGYPGHDLTVDQEKWSLKTQADKNLRLDALHISKFMEMGKGEWTDASSLAGLRERMFNHMEKYDRIFSLRHKLLDDETHYYELVEIPKALLMEASSGELEMREKSKQTPKPGYCRVKDTKGKTKFELYFDGGSERKLQIKKLMKSNCILHATWEFRIN